MNANEIMIGDWVRHRWTCCDTGREVVRDFQLAAIQKIGSYLYAWSKGGNAGNIEDIEPIPLTPEILGENGFAELNPGTWWYMDFHISLSTTRVYTLICGRTIQFRFIHELQHALKLCGIEKDIVL